jgi:hypothetical protein
LLQRAGKICGVLLIQSAMAKKQIPFHSPELKDLSHLMRITYIDVCHSLMNDGFELGLLANTEESAQMTMSCMTQQMAPQKKIVSSCGL